QGLRAVGRLDGSIRLCTAVRAGKRDVRRRMPVLREQNVRETSRKRVDDGDDLVAACDPQRAARAEVVLHINDKQRVSGLNRMHLALDANPTRLGFSCTPWDVGPSR